MQAGGWRRRCKAAGMAGALGGAGGTGGAGCIACGGGICPAGAVSVDSCGACGGSTTAGTTAGGPLGRCDLIYRHPQRQFKSRSVRFLQGWSWHLVLAPGALVLGDWLCRQLWQGLQVLRWVKLHRQHAATTGRHHTTEAISLQPGTSLAPERLIEGGFDVPLDAAASSRFPPSGNGLGTCFLMWSATSEKEGAVLNVIAVASLCSLTPSTCIA